MKLDLSKILALKSELENHSLLVTDVIQTEKDLQIFMMNHVFAVLDFMSLAKGVQQAIVPSGGLWIPTDKNRSSAARLINEIILGEETDISPDKSSYISHFDLYYMAMLEMGSDTKPVSEFIKTIADTGKPDFVKTYSGLVGPALAFSRHTYKTLEMGSHCIAASFCYGREDVIPEMFRRIVNQLSISDIDAPKFHYYLERHIEIDGDEHGDASKKIVEILCDNDPKKIYEAELAACSAIQARIKFFDELERLILKHDNE